MNIWEFLSDRNWLVAGMFLIIIGGVMYFVLAVVFSGMFRVINRYFRSRNIRHAGWPPNHLDADGDFKPVRTIKHAED